MPQIGPLEILVLGAVALIVFGPDKLPDVARSIGRFMSEVRRMATEVRSEFTSVMDEDEATPTEENAPIADQDDPASEER